MRAIRVTTIIIIWIMLCLQTFGAAVIPWPHSLAMPGVVFLRPGNQQDMTGVLIHELCHIRQIRAGRAWEDVTTLELECSCEEYFYYESIGHEPGMYRVLHYDIP